MTGLIAGTRDVNRREGCRIVASDADHDLDIERIVTEGHGLGLAIDDFAVMVHLAQPPFGVGLIGGHDAYVVHALACARSDIEAISGHCRSSHPISPLFGAAHRGRSRGVSGTWCRGFA